MNNLPPYRRYETLAGVEYEILSSDRKRYYTVPLLNGKATGCECEAAHHQHLCRHTRIAELEEALYQEQALAYSIPKDDKRLNAPLNGQREFSLMR